MTAQASAARLRQIQASKSQFSRSTGSRAETSGEGDKTTAELWLYGVVGGFWYGFNAESVASQLRGLDVETITVRLHSPGGNAIDGIAISNLLRNHKASITVVVDGMAASAASVIALAGDEIVMSPGSQMMIHDASLLTYGNAAELRDDADFVDKQSQNYAGIYAARAGGTADEWRQAMLAETWYTAEEAVTAGLADIVGTRTAASSPPVQPEGNDLEDDDIAARAAWDLDVLVHPAARAAWQPKPPTASADGFITTQEGSPAVAFSDEQLTTMRQELGIAEDADEATIVAALTEVLSEQAETSTSTTPQVPEGHVVIPAAELADLKAGAAQATATANKIHAQERDALLDTNRAKYLPENRAAWAKEYDRDPESVRKHFAGAPVLIPTSELGHDNPVDEAKSEDDAVYASVFGDEKGA